MSTSQHTTTALRGKVAVVTGGTRGIGRAIVESLLAEGAKLAFCGTSEQSVDTALQQLAGRGDVLGMVADVSKLDQVKHFISAVQPRFDAVDVLINNAGAGVFRPTMELAPEEW